jgi:hypothetical protein
MKTEKKSLKIPKGQPEAVYRRTDNTMAKRYQRGNSRISKNRQHNGTKISKGQSEAVFRRTDNTMAKRKSTKGQITINKAYI